jgi:hypothetical protein
MIVQACGAAEVCESIVRFKLLSRPSPPQRGPSPPGCRRRAHREPGGSIATHRVRQLSSWPALCINKPIPLLIVTEQPSSSSTLPSGHVGPLGVDAVFCIEVAPSQNNWELWSIRPQRLTHTRYCRRTPTGRDHSPRLGTG